MAHKANDQTNKQWKSYQLCLRRPSQKNNQNKLKRGQNIANHLLKFSQAFAMDFKEFNLTSWLCSINKQIGIYL